MPRIRQLAALTGAAALALTAVGAPAYAAGTEIHRTDTSPHALFAGNAQAGLLGNLVVNGGGTTTCTSATLTGSVDSDGDPLTMSSASVSGCSGIASAITFLNLPWTGTVQRTTGTTHDAIITLNGFSVRATVTLFGLTVNCTYGGTATAKGYNATNAARPVTSNNQAQVDMSGVTITRTGGSFPCPSSATIQTGAFQLRGEGSTAGTYNVPLEVVTPGQP
ncbi:hypothetical protein [Actinocorallia libanotica]|uniref:Neocarzinostatin family protein n=1 Tax=Actinocorallia libanotica TaxID=46162 RepID=A0ABP4CBK0_9ACTN